MERNNRKEKGVIVLLIIVALLMTIGFATYSANLKIDGTVNVSKATWSVHYDTAEATKYTETSGSVVANPKEVTDDTYSFTISLAKPGDFYEATVNVVNDGSFDAKLTKITMSTLTAAQQKYLKYTVTYNGTEYTETTDNLAIALDSGSTLPVKVRVEYIKPENSDDLPTTDVANLKVTGSFDYALAE